LLGLSKYVSEGGGGSVMMMGIQSKCRSLVRVTSDEAEEETKEDNMSVKM